LTNDYRTTISLDGEWSFEFHPETHSLVPVSGTIPVPACWESIYPDLMNKAGTGVYERTVSVPEGLRDKRIFLCFDAADYYTEVRLNGELVGTHEGGYLPFEMEVTGRLHRGDNTLTVSITDSTDKEDTTMPNGEVLRFAEVPHGKQSWYTSVGGLWQSVRLEARNRAFLKLAHFLPDIDAQTIDVLMEADNADGCEVRVRFDAPDGAADVAPLSAAFAHGHLSAVHSVPNPALWSPESPALYTAHVTLEQDGEILDAKSVRFGMRKIETRDGYVCLNNQPYFLIAALDQAFYPKTRYTPPSEEYLRDQFLKAKEMGLNMMRCHIKVPTESYLHLCDEIGLLVWYELPNGKELTTLFRERARQTLGGMWRRDASHPCIVILTIMNESWGIDLTVDHQREWMQGMYNWAKQQFPQWLVVDNSPCLPNYHVQGDLDDYHIYFNIPDHADQFEEWVEKYAERKAGTWSTYGDAVKTGTEPLLISEFGNWGLPRWKNIVEFEGESPYWFKVRTDGTRADGFLHRFHEQKLERVFGDYDTLADASQEQEWLSLKFEIETMRRFPQLGGYVITEFSDIDWEPNGLLDMGRNPKVFHDRLKDIQAQDVLFIALTQEERGAISAGDTRRLPVYFSQFSPRLFENVTVAWECADFPELDGSAPVKLASEGAVPQCHSLTDISVTAPKINAPTKTVLHFTLRDSAGTVLAHNTQNLVFVPAKIKPTVRPRLWLDDPTETKGLTHRLEDCGYAVQQDGDGAELCIATRWQNEVVSWVQNGGKALLAVTDRKSLTSESGLGFGVQDRKRSGWGGDWCTTKTWFVPEAFPSLPDTTRFDFELEKVAPRWVLTKMQSGDVLSGMFIGWINYPAGIVVRLKIGKGQLLITTFDLLPHLGDDPMATLLLNDLVALLG
jgi:hypothetical protein